MRYSLHLSCRPQKDQLLTLRIWWKLWKLWRRSKTRMRLLVPWPQRRRVVIEWAWQQARVHSHSNILQPLSLTVWLHEETSRAECACNKLQHVEKKLAVFVGWPILVLIFVFCLCCCCCCCCCCYCCGCCLCCCRCAAVNVLIFKSLSRLIMNVLPVFL